MKSTPAFQFYPADFLADENVALMSLAGRGAYITLICFCWREGSIPEDTVKMGRLCGIDGSAMAQLLGELLPCFELANGRYIHPRLEKERAKQVEYKNERSESGKRGAEKRWHNNINNLQVAPPVNQPMAKAIAEPLADDGSLSLSLSLSSSSIDSNSSKEELEKSGSSQPKNVQEIFEHWKTTLDHPRSVLDAKRSKIIKARLKEGFTVGDLKLAVYGCRTSDWHLGANDRNQRFDDIGLICRDAQHVEQFIGFLSSGDKPPGCPVCNGLKTIPKYDNNGEPVGSTDCPTCQWVNGSVGTRFVALVSGNLPDMPVSDRIKADVRRAGKWIDERLAKETGQPVAKAEWVQRGYVPQRFKDFFEERKVIDRSIANLTRPSPDLTMKLWLDFARWANENNSPAALEKQ